VDSTTKQKAKEKQFGNPRKKEETHTQVNISLRVHRHGLHQAGDTGRESPTLALYP